MKLNEWSSLTTRQKNLLLRNSIRKYQKDEGFWPDFRGEITENTYAVDLFLKEAMRRKKAGDKNLSARYLLDHCKEEMKFRKDSTWNFWTKRSSDLSRLVMRMFPEAHGMFKTLNDAAREERKLAA